MDYYALKRQTLYSDYVEAQDLFNCAMNEGASKDEAHAYLYRAGIVAGRNEAQHARKRMGQALTKAHDEIKRLRATLDAALKQGVKAE